MSTSAGLAPDDSLAPFGVGVVGLGRAGWDLHAATVAAMTDRFRLVAVCDAEPDRRAEAASSHRCRVYDRVDDLIADDGVDLVVIATPSHLHSDSAIRAMRAGRHVLVEKPFAESPMAAERMALAARDAGVMVAGVQNLRYEASFLKLQEVIRSGVLGEIIEIRISWHWFRRRWDWQTLRQFGGGTLNNDGSHVIDLALLLFGADEPDVFCRMAKTPLCLGDAEDHVKVILTGPGAPLIDIELSNACAYPADKWLVMGTRGTLSGGDHELRWRHIDPDLLVRRESSAAPTAGRSFNQEELPWVEERCQFPTEHYTSSVRRLYNAIYAALATGAESPVPLEDLLRQASVVERCRASAGEPWDRSPDSAS